MKEKNEEWSPISGYEGLYEVGNFGHVRGVDRQVCDKDARHISTRQIKGRILKPSSNGSKQGYLFVYLCKDGTPKRFYIHRLVARAFIPNPLNLPYINHKDENPKNNSADNLEWCTQVYNINYGQRAQKYSKSRMIPILQISIDGRTVTEWESAKTAGSALGFHAGTLTNACRGKIKSYKGFIWKYKYDYPHTKSTKKQPKTLDA